MKSSWKKLPLGDLSEIKGGKRLPKGKNLLSEKNSHPYIRVKDMHDGFVSKNDLLFVPDDVFPKISRYIINKDDVFISIVGTIGLVGIIDAELDGANLTENAAKISIVSKELLPKFLVYYLSSHEGQYQINSLTVGTTQPKLALNRIEKIKVPVPPLIEQEKIVEILSSFDDKIELNRQINQTLEAMARAIFKSWFVDFDPVYAKMEGRDYPLPPEIMDLFPDELEESELGLIPKGWTVDKLGERFEFAYGKSLPENKRISGTYKVYGSNGEVGWHNEKLVDGPGIVIGRKGNPGIVTFVFDDFYPIDTTFYVKTDLPFLFSYYLLKNLKLKRLSADSAVPGLNRNIAYLEKFLFPPDGIQKIYEGVIEPLYEKIKENNYQSNTLINIKNILIPRLLIK
jgi:type I restriction enzyme S subunit